MINYFFLFTAAIQFHTVYGAGISGIRKLCKFFIAVSVHRFVLIRDWLVRFIYNSFVMIGIIQPTIVKLNIPIQVQILK